MGKKILIIEDGVETIEPLRLELERSSFLVHSGTYCDEARQLLFTLKPVIVIIPFHHPFLTADDFLKFTMAFPIIFIGSSRDEKDVLTAFDFGAADYILKPFNTREVVARVKSIVKRVEITKSFYGKLINTNQIKIGDFTLYPESYYIDLPTGRVELTKKELQVLMLLFDKKNTFLSRKEILDFVWGRGYTGPERIVDVIISLLRQKIESDPRKPQYIKMIYGRGYRLDA